MKFELQKQPTGAEVTRFHVLDGKGAVCGVINVPNAEADSLVKHWRGAPAETAAPAARKKDSRAEMAAALLKGPKLSRQALLRS